MGPFAPLLALLAIMFADKQATAAVASSPLSADPAASQQTDSNPVGSVGGGGAGWSTTPLATPTSFYAFQSSLTQTHTAFGGVPVDARIGFRNPNSQPVGSIAQPYSTATS